jgi:radical SAM/Cys-rich protein
VLAFLAGCGAHTLDLTGGAPELNPQFRYAVSTARALGLRVIDRCNLTVLNEPGQEDLAEFLAAQRVEVTASLPCYLEENVDQQRGAGVYQGSITGLRKLNTLGYGRPDAGLILNLVYNPQGPVLPPAQQALEPDYKRELRERFGIVFNQLLTLTNMPISRFGSTLLSRGQFNDYMALLKSSHRDTNLDSVMCRNLLSVDWMGYLYDCDFNQMLSIPAGVGGKRQLHITDLDPQRLTDAPIAVGEHCFGCTAGQGSSCGGSLDQ